MNPEIKKALELLNQSDVVGLPTETVYGLAARVDRPQGLAKIFSVKARPLFDPLIVHVAGIMMAKNYVTEWNALAQVLAEKFWPGPLTLVLPKNSKVPDIVTAGLETVGLRAPKNELAIELIQACGVGLAAPSANRFGRTSPTRWEHVEREFAGKIFILKSEPSEIGIESTVLEIQQQSLTLHRLGAVSKTQIETVLNERQLEFHWAPFADSQTTSQATSQTRNQAGYLKKSPGQMQHHYMPEIPLVWVNDVIDNQEIINRYLAAAPLLPDQVEGVVINKASVVKNLKELKLSVDPVIAARELYHHMRLAAQSADLIFFRKLPIMGGEAWEPILERLTKAACLKLD